MTQQPISFISQKFRFYSFLSMFLLVFVHAYNLNNPYLQPFTLVEEPLTFTTFTEYFLSNGIFRFRIPMLFLISGYWYALHDAKPYGVRMKKRLMTILLPYLIWSAVGLAITYLWQQFPVTAKAVSDAQLDQMGDNRPYEQIGWSGMLQRWILTPVSFQLWFLRVLLIYNAIYPALKWLVQKATLPWFIVAGLLWFVTAGFYFVEGEGLLFFTLGIWINKRKDLLLNHPGWMNINLMWILFLFVSAGKTVLAFVTAPTGFTFWTLMLLHKVAVFTGLVAFWYGADTMVRYFTQRNWFAWICGFSFIIYALHVPLVNYCTQLAYRYYNDVPQYRIITYFGLSLVVIAVCIIVGWLLRTLLPRVYAVMTGGRGL